MKKLMMALVPALLLAGCATEKVGFVPSDGALKPSDPKAYASYGPAMKHVDGYQMAYEWQTANPELVKEATKPDVLAKFVENDASADAILAKIGTAYDGDPVVLTQIAAVTQLVMCPKCDKAPAARKIWVAALKRSASKTKDGYVRTFCAQQLRLCDYAK